MKTKVRDIDIASLDFFLEPGFVWFKRMGEDKFFRVTHFEYAQILTDEGYDL